MTKEVSKAMVAPDKRRWPTVVARREGDQALIDCPHCGEEHVHGWGEGHRVSHCDTNVPGRERDYYLDCGGDDGDDWKLASK